MVCNRKIYKLFLTEYLHITGGVDKEAVTETLDSNFILGWVQPKTLKNLYLHPYLTFSNKKDECGVFTVFGRQMGSLTRRPNGL